MQPDARLLAGLLDHKAAVGGTFSVGEARLDLALRPDEAERARAERWGWSRRQVRNLLRSGDADPNPARTKADHERTKADQKTAPAITETQEADQSGTKADHERTTPAPSISNSPLPPTGAVPPGGPSESAGGENAEGIGGQIALLRAEAERNAAAAERARAEREAAEAERKRLKAEQRATARREAFAPPTLAAVRAYAAEKGLDPAHAEAFCNYHTARGWRIGRANVPMKDWRAAYRTWLGNVDEFDRPKNGRPLDAENPLDVNPLGTMTARQAKAFGEHHGIPAHGFIKAPDSPSGVPLWRAKPECLIAAGVVTEQQVLDSQRKRS